MKPNQPKSESELRIISITPFISKIFEGIVMDWLLMHVAEKMDWSQYGGSKGSSTSHYLVDMISYILYNQDLKEPKAVLTAMVDFEKAFNRQNHNKLLTKLNDLGVPGWLLNIVKGFLENRTLAVKHKGVKSEAKKMPGGGPQGTLLGLFLFLVLINDAGFPELNKDFGERITRAITKRKQIDPKHWKYVDDLTLAEAIDLKTLLEKDTNNVLEKPLTYHNRTEHILPPHKSRVQEQLNDILEYANENEMKINKRKTKVMVFNTARTRDFTPELNIEDEPIETVDSLKLLCVVITSDLRWNENTEYITKRGYNKLWMLRRLKTSGANQQELVDIYCKHIRSILEYAAVVWHSALTKLNISDIERVQKSALGIILGTRYNGYQNALSTLNLEKLSERRTKLCLSFAKKAFKSEKYSSWFAPDKKVYNTRRTAKKLKNVQTRTARFKKSTIPYISQLLNTV